MQPKLTSSEVASGDMPEMRLHVSAKIFLMGFFEPFGVGYERPRQLGILSRKVAAWTTLDFGARDATISDTNFTNPHELKQKSCD